MFSYKSFCDLSICETNIPKLKEICATLVEYGYRSAAVNQIMDDPQFSSKKKKKGEGQLNPIPEPVCLDEIQKMFEGKLTIVNRLTFGFSDQQQAHSVIQHAATRKYDVLAAIPKTQTAYQYVCTSLNVDIVSFDPANKYPIKQHRKMYNLAARRGLYFELMYGPASSEGATRQSIISRGHQYHYFGKSNNILITSNASIPLQVRGPYDVVNVGLLFGLSEEQSKFAISEAGKKVLRRAASRKLGKIAPILIKHVGSDCEEEDEEEEENDDDTEMDEGSLKKRPRIA